MVRLITMNNPRIAQAFIDYMASRSIDVRMMPEGNGQFVLWLMDTQHQVEVDAELKQFLDNPNDEKYHAASWDMAESRTNNFHYQTPSIGGMIKAKAGILTLSLMVACSLVFIFQQLGFGQALFSLFHFPAFEQQQWQLWRWLSHAVLHFSAMHIIFNLLWWWQLGGDIEKILGTTKLAQLFILSAVLSGAAQYWLEGANFGGLSGVVYALVGYSWMLSHYKPSLGLHIQKPIVAFMLVWLVLGFVQPFMAIANAAHLAGLLAGIGVGLWDVKLTSSAK